MWTEESQTMIEGGEATELEKEKTIPGIKQLMSTQGKMTLERMLYIINDADSRESF